VGGQPVDEQLQAEADLLLALLPSDRAE